MQNKNELKASFLHHPILIQNDLFIFLDVSVGSDSSDKQNHTCLMSENRKTCRTLTCNHNHEFGLQASILSVNIKWSSCLQHESKCEKYLYSRVLASGSRKRQTVALYDFPKRSNKLVPFISLKKNYMLVQTTVRMCENTVALTRAAQGTNKA
jgi:hypothetical protein